MRQKLYKTLVAGLMLMALIAGLPQPARAAVTVTVSPNNVYLPLTWDKTFTALVSGAMNSAVTWSVNGIPGGSMMVGTITAQGYYTAPSSAALGTMFTITASSVEDPAAMGTAKVTISNPAASVSSYNPSQLVVGSFTLQVFGVGFMNGAKIYFNNTPLTTSFMSSSFLSGTGTAVTAGTATIMVQNPSAVPSQTLTINVVASGSGGGGGSPPPPPPGPEISVTVAPVSIGVPAGGTQQFQATVNNSANQQVTWNVNGTAGGNAAVGLISAAGLYTAPAAIPNPNVVTVSATSAADGTKTGNATVTIQNPQAITWGRFLDQTTYGATPALMAQVQQSGIDAFLDDQFAMPESPLPPDNDSRAAITNAVWGNAFTGNDQLRQRVIQALSEVVVISFSKNTNANMVIPYVKILSKNAFGNYKQLLKDVTLDGGMGHFLDLANSGGSGAPNENYPREIMQLFSIGLFQLNQNGSVQLDGNGQPIPTYTQTDVVGLAKALTGWTWNSPTGTIGGGGNNSFYPGPMLPMPARHVAGTKTFLGQTLPAGQTIQQDLDGAIDIIFNHPNVGPFIATRLIRALVTSNPSPAYIQAVAGTFNDNGSGVRGDMKAVIRAILKHPEARNDSPGNTFGRLRTPEQFFIGVARSLNLNLGQASNFNYLLEGMGEGVLNAPSVFGHYSPLFKIPASGGLFGPEFQIYSASDAANRANFLYSMLYVYPSVPALAPFISIGGNSQALIDAVDNALLFGRMSQTLRTAIANSLPAMPDNNQRAINAIYLTATSGEYLVQR